MKRLLFLLPGLAVLAGLSAPPLATARGTLPAAIQFDLPADHGLHAHLETFNGEVTLEIKRRGRGATYETEGESTAAGLKVQFGKLGRIDLAFEPTETRRENPPKGCTGPPSTTSEGAFVGSIEFSGEHGFVHIEASRVSGTLEVSRESEWKCRERAGPEFHPSAPPRSSLPLERRAEAATEPATLTARDPRCRCFFAAYAVRDRHGRGPTFFVGAEIEQREAMKITRATYARAGASRFLFDHAAGTATVRPPAPFSGHAVFRRRPHGRSTWRSTLRVPLLGAEPLSPQGPEARPQLLRSFPDDGR